MHRGAFNSQAEFGGSSKMVGCKMVAVFSTVNRRKYTNLKVYEAGLSRLVRNREKWGFRNSSKAPYLLVGTTRFELATSRTPSDLGRFV